MTPCKVGAVSLDDHLSLDLGVFRREQGRGGLLLLMVPLGEHFVLVCRFGRGIINCSGVGLLVEVRGGCFGGL